MTCILYHKVVLYCTCFFPFYAEPNSSDLNLWHFRYLPYGIEIYHIVYEKNDSDVPLIPSVLNILSQFVRWLYQAAFHIFLQKFPPPKNTSAVFGNRLAWHMSDPVSVAAQPCVIFWNTERHICYCFCVRNQLWPSPSLWSCTFCDFRTRLWKEL